MVRSVCPYLDCRNRFLGRAATNGCWFLYIILTSIFQLLLVVCNRFLLLFKVKTKAGYILHMQGCTY